MSVSLILHFPILYTLLLQYLLIFPYTIKVGKNKDPPCWSGIPCVCNCLRSRFIHLLAVSVALQWEPDPTPSLCHCNISRGPGLVTPASLFSSSFKRKEYLGVTCPGTTTSWKKARCTYLFHYGFSCMHKYELSPDFDKTIKI